MGAGYQTDLDDAICPLDIGPDVMLMAGNILLRTLFLKFLLLSLLPLPQILTTNQGPVLPQFMLGNQQAYGASI